MSILSPVHRCSKCGALKLFTEFDRSRNQPGGRYPVCKACRKDTRAAHTPTQTPDPVRTCRDCGEHKPLSEFHRDRGRSDGFYPYCKTCVRAYNQANIDAKRQRNQVWQQTNHEKVVRYSVAWQQRNPTKAKARHHRYKARLYGSGGSFTADEWRALCDWFGNQCLVCGKSKVSIDHVVPVAKGGRNTIENLQPLCLSCNASKGDQTIDYRDPDRLSDFFHVYYGDSDP